MIALSLTVLTGWAGQVSLGQFGLVACGALDGRPPRHERAPGPAHAVRRGGDRGDRRAGRAARPAGAGPLPGREHPGLQPLVHAVGAGHPVLDPARPGQAPCAPDCPTPSPPCIARPSLFGIGLGSERAFAWFSLGVLVLSVLWSGCGATGAWPAGWWPCATTRPAPAALGIPLARTKLLAFALSGFIAGYAGVCLAFATERFSTTTFDPTFSILVVSMVVIGGLGSIAGAVLGALYLVGLPGHLRHHPDHPVPDQRARPAGLHPLPPRRAGRAAPPARRPGDLGWRTLRAGGPPPSGERRPIPNRRPEPVPGAPAGQLAGRAGRTATATPRPPSPDRPGARPGPPRGRGGGGGLRRGPGASTGPTCRPSPGPSSGSSAPTGRARPPCSTSSRDWSPPRPVGAPRRREPGRATCPRSGRPSGWSGRSRTAGSSPSCRWRTCCCSPSTPADRSVWCPPPCRCPGPAGPSGPSGPRWTR